MLQLPVVSAIQNTLKLLRTNTIKEVDASFGLFLNKLSESEVLMLFDFFPPCVCVCVCECVCVCVGGGRWGGEVGWGAH